MLVKDLLEAGMVTINPTDTIATAWKDMSASRVTGAVVVTDEGQIVGFITDGDLVRTCMPSGTDITIYDEIIESMELPGAYIRQIRSMKVEDAMQNADNVVTIDQNEPSLKALALMFQHHLRRIPVTDGNKLIGTINRGQILTDILIDRVTQEA